MTAIPADRWGWLCSCGDSGDEATEADADMAVDAHVRARHPGHNPEPTTDQKADQ